jgi:hypothetical protein
MPGNQNTPEGKLMTDDLISLLDNDQQIRVRAVELAIKEIDVYSKNGPINSTTPKLLNSAKAIADFIKTGNKPF